MPYENSDKVCTCQLYTLQELHEPDFHALDERGWRLLEDLPDAFERFEALYEAKMLHQQAEARRDAFLGSLDQGQRKGIYKALRAKAIRRQTLSQNRSTER